MTVTPPSADLVPSVLVLPGGGAVGWRSELTGVQPARTGTASTRRPSTRSRALAPAIPEGLARASGAFRRLQVDGRMPGCRRPAP